MRFNGHADLQQNQLQRAALQVESNFPATPVVGRVVFKDSIVYICVDLGNDLPVWVPLTQQISNYTHNQGTASTSWTITHNLNANTPTVQIYDLNSRMIIPDDIEIIDRDTIHVTFGVAQAGRAAVMQGAEEGNQRPDYAFILTVTNPATTWVATHNLGYNPIVRVFIGNEEVQPLTVVHDSVNQVTITFSSPQVGQARFI